MSIDFMPIFALPLVHAGTPTPQAAIVGNRGLLTLVTGATHSAHARRAPACCGHRQSSPSGQAICLGSRPNYLLRDAHCQPVGVQ